jgi:hypothetical protein
MAASPSGGGFSLGLSSATASAAGGGNVFNQAPIWGSVIGSRGGSSSGDNGATATPTATTATGPGSASTPVSLGNSARPPVSLGATAAPTNWPLLGLGGLILAGLAYLIFRK